MNCFSKKVSTVPRKANVLLGCSILLTIAAAFAQDADPRSPSEQTLKIFDALCMQNDANLKNIDAIAAAEKWRSLSAETLAAAAGGAPVDKGYAFKEKNRIHMVAYHSAGTCVVTAKEMVPAEVRKLLLINYKLRAETQATLSEGFQISEAFRFSKESVYAGGLVMLTYEKQSPDGLMTIAFMTSKRLQEALGR